LSFNRHYLLVALAFLLLAAAYLGYRWHQQQLFSSVWAFIPPSAVLVVESAHPADDLGDWQESRPGGAARKLPYVQQLLARLNALQKVSPEVTRWLRTNRVAASLHVTAPDDFDYLFYLSLPAGPDRDLFVQVTTHFAKRRGYRTDSRNFGGFLIQEITHAPTGTRFSYILHDAVVVGSYSPFLVEDVVRTLNQTSTLNPNPWIALQKRYPAGDDGLHVYLSGAGLPRLAGVFASAVLDGEMRGLAHFTHSARLTAKPAPDGFFLAGEGKFGEKKETADYLATFRGQSPKASGLFTWYPPARLPSGAGPSATPRSGRGGWPGTGRNTSRRRPYSARPSPSSTASAWTASRPAGPRTGAADARERRPARRKGTHRGGGPATGVPGAARPLVRSRGPSGGHAVVPGTVQPGAHPATGPG
jgi:hypothetical protein